MKTFREYLSENLEVIHEEWLMEKKKGGIKN